MEIGVKTLNNPNNFLKYFENKADFYEVIAKQTKGIDFFKKMKSLSLPFVIHAEHFNDNVNYADKSKYGLNSKSLNFARRVADELKAEKIIIHAGIFSYPGLVEQGNLNISLDNSVSFLRKINDSRILTENLARYHLEKTRNLSHMGYKLQPSGFYNFPCATPEETKEFIERTGLGFCFDISHQVFTAMYLKKNYLEDTPKFLVLSPKHYHLSGQKVREISPRIVEEIERDHIYLADSNLDLRVILEQFPFNAQITLETELDRMKIENDIKIVKKAIRGLKN